MGMQVRLVLYAPAEPVARAAAERAFREIARLDGLLSNYRADSEINALAAHAGAARPASPELLTVLQRAGELARLTAGAFDVTAAPLTALWREAVARGELPAEAAIRAARRRVGFHKLRVDAGQGTVTLDEGMALDLGGIAKGFILDRALARLHADGIDRALVEAGGDVVVGRAPPGRDGWRVDVPRLGCVVQLENAAIASSGDEFQFVEIDGTRYSHVVDPRTGRGLTRGRAATVVAPDGLTADGLATAFTVVDHEEADGLLASFPQARVLATGCSARDDSPKLRGTAPDVQVEALHLETRRPRG